MTLVASKSRQKGLAGRKREAALERKRAAETAAILARKEAERDAAIAARKIADAQLGGLGRNLTTREVIEVQRRLEEEEHRRRAWHAEMAEAPDTRDLSGRATAAHGR